jgi:hypothetical protein
VAGTVTLAKIAHVAQQRFSPRSGHFFAFLARLSGQNDTGTPHYSSFSTRFVVRSSPDEGFRRLSQSREPTDM